MSTTTPLRNEVNHLQWCWKPRHCSWMQTYVECLSLGRCHASKTQFSRGFCRGPLPCSGFRITTFFRGQVKHTWPLLYKAVRLLNAIVFAGWVFPGFLASWHVPGARACSCGWGQPRISKPGWIWGPPRSPGRPGPEGTDRTSTWQQPSLTGM